MKARMTLRTGLGLLLLVLGTTACAPREADELPAGEPAADAVVAEEAAAANTLSEAEREVGWRLLFNGEDFAGWRGFRQDDVPGGWTVTEDGALHFTGHGGRGDLITEEEFGDFELSLEWKIAPEGNSGIFYRVSEDEAFADVPSSAPEYQVIDNQHPGLGEAQTAGANYDLHAPARDVTRPAGEWNQTRIVVDGAHVEHWLNGEKVVEYELWSDDWKQRVAASKFADWTGYGQQQQGHIALQDHGDEVWYRNIKIRPL